MKFFIEELDSKQYLVLRDENGDEKSRQLLDPANPCAGCQYFVGACVSNCTRIC